MTWPGYCLVLIFFFSFLFLLFDFGVCNEDSFTAPLALASYCLCTSITCML